MCGFAGFVEFSKPSLSASTLTAMRSQIGHRGPDDQGCYFEPGFGLCHTRLSIIDLSSKGHQPMQRDNLIISYNGEVYNYRELRQELTQLGHRFYSNTDTEVVLGAFQAWQTESFLRLNGMFAYAIYNCGTKQLFLVRDRTGTKPLFYYYDGVHMAFGSEIKALVAYPHFKKRLSQAALRDYLSFGYTTGEQTIWENCYRLLPGHYMKVDLASHSIETVCYWRPDFQYHSVDLDFREAVNQTRTLLVQELQRSVVGDVPIGLCLSGGVDSNVIASLMAKELGLQLATFSLGSKEARYDENGRAGEVSRFLKTSHTSISLDDGNHSGLFIDTVQQYDEPMADQNVLSFRLIAKRARDKGIIVLLSGMGGDEIFLGYPSVFLRAFIKPLFSIPLGIRQVIPRQFFQNFRKLYKGIHLLQLQNYLLAVRGITGNCFYQDEIDRLLVSRSSNGEKTDAKEKSYFDRVFYENFYRRESALEKVVRCDFACYLPNNGLAIVDASMMLESVEMRVPFLNSDILRFALPIPMGIKHRNWKLKAILRAIERQYLPERLITKGKFGFYPFVKSVWLDRYLGSFLESLFSRQRIEKQGLFKHDYIRDLLYTRESGRLEVTHQLWNLLVFQIWAQTHFSEN